MHISENELKSVYSLLTPRIEADLSSWYGSEARLLGESTFHPRAWSYFFRYQVQVDDGKQKTVLAKVRHIEEMNILSAMQDVKMHEEMIEEFDSLVKIRDVFTNAKDAGRFDTIRHLVFYEDLNILVMEEADIQTLKSRFHKPAMWIGGDGRKNFEKYLELTGQWLRVFHNQFGQASDGPFFSEKLHQETQVRLQRIQTFSGHDLKSIKSFMESLYDQYQDKSMSYRITHDNFSLANVFVTGEEKICSFDPHNKPGSMYLDIAKLLTDMETSLFQLATYGRSVPPSALDKFNASFLNGYFQSEPVDMDALNLYRLILLLERWDEMEERIAYAAGVRKLVFGLGVIPIRNYFLWLVRRLM